jgi:hypothetical protein
MPIARGGTETGAGQSAAGKEPAMTARMHDASVIEA